MRTYSAVSILLLALVMMSSAGFAQVVINEAYSRGVTGNLDWVEVYNPSGAAIDISAYKIYDDGGQSGSKDKKPFPAGTVLAAHGYYVIITDTASVGLNDKFGLSSTGDKVWLENGSGAVIDSVVVPALGTDTSVARQTDGSVTWVKLAPTTRGTTNSQVVMNEIFSRGSTGNLDWIEIYNASDNTIDISGYKIYDSGGYGGSKPKKEFPSGTIIPTHGFSVIITDTNSTGLTDGFGLSTSGEAVWLENASGLVIDTVFIAALGADTSFARRPDGSANWVKMSPLTRGATNGAATAVQDAPDPVATTFALMQNYPNPFNPKTIVSCQLSATSRVRLGVYDLLGREVATLMDEQKEAGTYRVEFDGALLSSGVYVCRMTAGSFVSCVKMALVK